MRDHNELRERLCALRAAAGSPSFTEIVRRIGAVRAGRGVPPDERRPGRVTVYDCFRPGRRRLDVGLVADIVLALGADEATAARVAGTCQELQGRRRATPVVTTLPDPVAHFTGRRAELDAIRSGPPRTVLVTGMAGVGKTQLALRAGVELARERRLMVDLRGVHPESADPFDVLGAFLRALGVAEARIPPDLAGRRRRYRDLVRAGGAVIVLDNAADADQVRPLLATGPGCHTLVTSRRDLAGLPDALDLRLGPLSEAESVNLLRAAGGADRVDAEPSAAAELARLAGYLPLALALAAGHMAVCPKWTMIDHMERLRIRLSQHRLDDAIRDALDLSYAALPAPARRVLRRLALHPGGEITVAATAALAGVPDDAARELLTTLCGNHLVAESGDRRYTVHVLVRTYATARTYDEDGAGERRAALTRLFDQLLGTAARSGSFGNRDSPGSRPAPCR